MMNSDSLVQTSVISSSSLLPLRTFMTEFLPNCDLDSFDITILRDIDITSMDQTKYHLMTNQTIINDRGQAPDIALVLSDPENRERVLAWLDDECTAAGVGKQKRISALSSYFPGVTSLYPVEEDNNDGDRREEAISALANTVIIAVQMCRRQLMWLPVVEAVCGTVVDTCRCKTCRAKVATTQNRKLVRDNECMVYIYDQHEKIKFLCEALQKVCDIVKKALGDVAFGIALELEPGQTYVLNGLGALHMLKEELNTEKFRSIRPHIGLNLDMAHMKIARIEARHLGPFRSLIVHSHIADNPRLHTRDQAVGTWTPTDRSGSEYLGFFELMKAPIRLSDNEALPFTGTVALELEGCNRTSWVHHSLVTMKCLARAAASGKGS